MSSPSPVQLAYYYVEAVLNTRPSVAVLVINRVLRISSTVGLIIWEMVETKNSH